MSSKKFVEYRVESVPQPDTVGSIDFGILAAAWSPDEFLLALITGNSSASTINGDPNGDPRRQQVNVDDVNLRRSLRSTLTHGRIW